MFTKIVSQDDLSTVVSLEEAKRACRMMDSIDDIEIASLITVSAQLAQTYTRKLLSPGVVSIETDEYSSVVSLPYGNISSITSVYLNDIETTDYTFSSTTSKLKLNDTYSNLKVTYECGYTDVPQMVKQGILTMVSTMYNNHEDIILGMTVEKMPLSSLVLLNSVKDYNV